MRILYYAINGSGLGHLMRCSAIAVAVRRQAPHVHQLLATSANYPAHLKRLKMPAIVLPSDDSGSHSESNRRERTVSAELNGRILRHTIREYDPELVVFDTHAPRRLVEDVRVEGRKSVLVFRRCREEYIREYLRDGLFANYDLVLLPYTREEFSDSISPDVLDELHSQATVRYTGGIAFPLPLGKQAVERAADRHGIRPKDTLILITAGSGGYDHLNRRFLANAARAASTLRRRKPSTVTLCVAGPYARTRIATPGCSYVESDPDLQLLMARADLVIAHGGYNSIQEILRTGTRAIVVPVYRRAEDQAIAADHLAARGRVQVLSPDSTERVFLQACEQQLASPRPPRERVLGAAAAAGEILALAAPTAHYICCRDAAESSGALTCASPEELAEVLAHARHSRALVRIDWDHVQPLLTRLGSTVHSRLAVLEVHLGEDTVEEIAARAAWVYSQIEDAGYDRSLLAFSIDDSTCGSLLVEFARLVRGLQFRALVARVPRHVLNRSPTSVFQALELCRQLRTSFKVDVAVLEQGFVYMDQP